MRPNWFVNVPILAPWADPPHRPQGDAQPPRMHRPEDARTGAWRETHAVDPGIRLGAGLR